MEVYITLASCEFCGRTAQDGVSIFRSQPVYRGRIFADHAVTICNECSYENRNERFIPAWYWRVYLNIRAWFMTDFAMFLYDNFPKLGEKYCDLIYPDIEEEENE